MAEEIIRVESVSKKYCSAPRRAVLYAASDIARAFVGLPVRSAALRQGEFWAVRDVSFSLCRGESLAIIGSNGSGKSTLLNLLNGVLLPDAGRIDAKARIGALAAIGAGFNPLMTGRENIAVNGLMLGMSLREVRDLSDAIIDFAEIGDFIDVPVHQYSSGMYVRLGFAIAVHAPVDLLLVDEVLAVGDLAFAQKCLRKIVEFRTRGGSVVLISHNMKNVKFACDQAMWMEKGIVRQFGTSIEVANTYELQLSANGRGMGEVVVHDDRIRIVRVDCPATLQSGGSLQLTADLEFGRDVERPVFNVHLFSSVDDTLVFSHHSDLEGYHWDHGHGRMRLTMTTDPLPLRRGNYLVTFSVSEREMINPLAGHYKLYRLEVTNDRDMYGTVDAGMKFDLTAQP